MTDLFRVGITADFLVQAPGLLEPAIAQLFQPLGFIETEHFEPSGVDEAGPFVTPSDIADYDAVMALAPRFMAASFDANPRLAVIARWGVGYDRIDVEACTAHDVLLSINVDAVRRPVAEAIVTLLLALAKQMPEKDRIVRTGRWQDRSEATGLGIRGKVLGSVGLGSIAGEMFRLLQPFGFGRLLAADPYASPDRAAELGVELVDLDTIFSESDFVTVNCLLNDETRGLVNAQRLAQMKPTAYIINTARGPLIDQDALVHALQSGQIAGAGLDVFEQEPLPPDHPLTGMDNVILAPHSLAWTDELYVDNSADTCRSVLAVLAGDLPKYPVNPEVADRPAMQTKLESLRARWQTLT